jgi:flagellar basal-body rod protein FlgB
MDLAQIPLFAMLKGKLGHLTERQRVISENVANSNTPGFVARDLTPFSFTAKVNSAASLAAAQAGAPARSQPMHLAGTISGGKPKAFRPRDTGDTETTLDGNQVVLEDQMMKLTQSRMDYDAAITFYQKSMGLLKMAARKPSGG